ncbi:MAG: riboflavin synthase [Coxiella sp. (in: Bacteria)]|nr:MAG: riboflavin synthase [Coxiella sp. (in: g-proteobacteria)]
MFTGLVNHTGVITRITETLKGLRFSIATQFNDLTLGESITVDGACLTVTDIEGATFCCDVSPETLALTIAGTYQINQIVNLERSLLASDRLGGHYVTGHVDQRATVVRVSPVDDYIEFVVGGFSAEQRAYLIPKGSLTINGVSLTINKVQQSDISFMLIPHTLEITNLKQCQPGKAVNIEFDYYAKVIAHQFALYKEALV